MRLHLPSDKRRTFWSSLLVIANASKSLAKSGLYVLFVIIGVAWILAWFLGRWSLLSRDPCRHFNFVFDWSRITFNFERAEGLVN